MNLRWVRPVLILPLTAWLGTLCTAEAASKSLRLRNEIIRTDPPGEFMPAAGDTATSGLYLVQLKEPARLAWRQELQSLGVSLLHYVPDDGFVARLEKVSIQQLRAMPFIQWVGEYRADHKLHSALKPDALPRANPEPVLSTVLLSSDATAAEVADVRAVLEEVRQETPYRFGRVMRGSLLPSRLDAMARLPAVLWIELAPRMKLFDEVSSEIVAGSGAPTNNYTFTQQYGFDGRGVRVAVVDSGLHLGDTNLMHPDLAGRVFGLFQYGSLTSAADYFNHGTHVAGIIAGNAATGEADSDWAMYGLGVAPRAGLVVQRVFDGDGAYHAPASFRDLTQDAVRSGAEIGSNSWGEDTQGRYDVSAAEFDELARDADGLASGDQPFILQFAAGNAGPGPQSLGSPAVAKNVIATGASQSDRTGFLTHKEGRDAMADFSSRGPCEDGRIKPDVVAPGTWIASLRSPVGNDANAWEIISDNYLYLGGTSQAGPHVAGAAAVFVQYYRQTYAVGTPSPALVKAALINSAEDMDNAFGTTAAPNSDEGWGRVDLTTLILSERVHQYIDQDQTPPLTTGQTSERRFVIASTGQPLKLTLCYTDVPGFPAAIPALVNDLDLELLAPDGRVYRGNQFQNGESVPDAPSSDNINNVEGIRVTAPVPGEYVARVIARRVAQDSCAATPGADQDFALVICGDIPPEEAGTVFLDRRAYRAPGRIQIRLIDLDLMAEPSVTVRLKSATETAGETVLLNAASAGVLTGSIATATGPAVSNGVLQITHGDWIEAQYFDASESTLRTATATADLFPPVLTNVSAVYRFGQTIVSWNTDEPADTLVRFGTNFILNQSAAHGRLSTVHQIELTNLVPGRTYYFKVESTDAAGNRGTNSNQGALYSFLAQSAPTVLLVDAYVADPDAPVIPLETYTDALDQVGAGFDVWDISSRPMPTLANLRPYQIIIWRINDSFVNRGDDAIPPAQQSAIQQYLEAGGSFFMASMEVLSRLGQVPFRTNVLHARQFVTRPSQFNLCAACDENIGVSTALGLPNDPVTAGMNLTLDYSQYPRWDFLGFGPDLGDTFTPATTAAPIFLNPVNQRSCGIRFPVTGEDSTGRVVFVSFPLDAIPATGPAPNPRAAFLRNVIQFLAPGFEGFGTVALNKAQYRLPDQLVIEVADPDLAGAQVTFVDVQSDSDPAAVPVMLRETTRPGVFRGFITLVPAANPPSPGVLRANPGDQVMVEYFDHSANVAVHALATVDALLPAISDLAVKPGFDDAMISWTTSEPTDALVQFGESPLLGRTAYLPDFDTNHQLRLTGLLPDHAYYFQVVSRDAAGNTVVDNNQGQPHSFLTRPPLNPPYLDNLEAGGTNWSVLTAPPSLAHWRLGSPNNTVESAAHSPFNCWGSSLSGEARDTIDTSLISPALELTGGNLATLRFWHRYSFTRRTAFDVSEYGELLVVTNSLAAPVVLATYTNANPAWELQTIDLTPYVGRVVFLVWRHQLQAFDSAPRAGWLVDDIEVTMANVPPGTIYVTNNLAQARFVLHGPISRSGQGWSHVISNATPGSYVITWTTVPYYQTPAPQTNVLAPGGTVTFQGFYTFADAYTNGMSDAWEQQFFGGVFPARTRSTDTDGDGFPDYAEFTAGTNPQLTNSHLRLQNPVLQANGTARLQWPSVIGRAYRVQGSDNLREWTPLSGWLSAVSGTTVAIVPGATNGGRAYRLEVRP